MAVGDDRGTPAAEGVITGAGEAVLRAIASGHKGRRSVMGISRLLVLVAEQGYQLSDKELSLVIKELEQSGLLRRSGVFYLLTPGAAALGYQLPWERPLAAHPRTRPSALAG